MTVGAIREIWRYPVKSMAGERLDRSDVGPRGLFGDRGWAVRNEDTGEIHNAKRHPVLMRCAAVYREAPREDHIPDVDITFPDGTVVGSDTPALHPRLSALLGQRVSLRRVEPATNKAYYRRHDPGAAVLGRLAKSRTVRQVLQWALTKGAGAGELRQTFGREPEEPLPDLTDVPAEAFEFYTPPGTYFDLFPIHVLTTASLSLMARLNPAATWDVKRFRPNVVIDTGLDASDHPERQWIGRTIRIGESRIKGELPTVRCAMPMHPQRDLPRDPSILRTIVRDADQCLGLYASIVASGRAAAGDPVDVR